MFKNLIECIDNLIESINKFTAAIKILTQILMEQQANQTATKRTNTRRKSTASKTANKKA